MSFGSEREQFADTREQTADASPRRQTVARAVESWVKQLIDLTGRNQLLYYRTLKRGTLELTNRNSDRVSHLLSGGKVRLSDLFPATDEDPERFDDALKRARTIYDRSVKHYEERGIDTLFVAVGMANWTTTSSSATPAAPVLLSPVALTPKGAARADFDLSLRGDWDINATLLHLLATEFSVDIHPEPILELLEPPDSAATFEPQQVFDRLAKEARDVPDFKVVRRVVVGTFLYTKLPMVRDLQASVDELAAHDLIAAVAGVEEAREAVREMHARDVDPTLPDRTPPEDEFLVLPADASQNYAINATVAGEPLIIQGPPGTGKSQTIANLIATLTARGQKVLFVAEKRAAIDAVTKRLRTTDLEDLVLDLHGGTTSKKQLAADLKQTLRDIGSIASMEADDLYEALTKTRKALTDHAQALHELREPWGLSVWQIYENLLALTDVPDLRVRLAGRRLLQLDAATVREAKEVLREWRSLAQPVLSGASPWAGAKVKTQDEARQVLDVVSELAYDSVPETADVLDSVLGETGLAMPGSVAEWQELLKFLEALTELMDRVSPEVWALDLEEITTDLESASRGWWHRMVAQLFDSRYRRAKGLLRQVWRGNKVGGRQLHQTATRALDLRARWTDFGGNGDPKLSPSLRQAAESYGALLERLAAVGAFLVTRDLAETSHRQLHSEVEALAADQQTLFRLPRLHELETWCAERHLTPFLEAVREQRIPPDQLVGAFELAWLESLRTELTARDPRLASFDGDLQRQRVEEFRRTDEKHQQLTPLRVRRAVAEHAVEVLDSFPDQYDLVRAQANRKRGHLPLRKLFERAPQVLTALRPCWAMSPLVVSQTLPAEPIFDVVIFDEASQVLPADAVPALLRAPRAVVAGDRHQLPPTTFFDAGQEEELDHEDGAELTQGFESILDVLEALLRDYMLTWHYRSEDERLIAFSNHRIYEGSLITFPGALSADCLDFVLIPHRPGVRVDTRSNDDEVERVVQLMIDHARRRPNETLGVIAMGLHHARRIEALLRERLADERDPDLDSFFDDAREERAFVKNLERVQGDERDAILLSIGYAKQADGRLLYRFGPLNMEGGERRLNVAVTRARKRLTVVSSFSHTDMDPGRSSARGVELLRLYLKYAESGGIDLDGAEAKTPLNPFEISVKTRLEREGLTVIPQYGTSGYRIDFAVPHPDQPGEMLLAIEADGASYHSSPTARDRDRLRQKILEDRGWTFHRIWSTDWFNNQDKEVAKVLEACERALQSSERRQRDPVRNASEGQSEVPREGPGAWASRPTRRRPRPPVPRGEPITAYSHSQLVSLARWIASDTLLRTEDQLITEMMEELGFQRRGKRILAALQRAIRDM